MEPVIVFLAGLAGGFVNVIAGGALVFVFPFLLAAGLPPMVANATASVGLWPAQVPGVLGHWSSLRRSSIGPDILVAMAGALLGASLLPVLGEGAFTAVVPWFLYAALATILLGPRLVPETRGTAQYAGVARTLIFLASVYGGYFGAGYSYVLLAAVVMSGVTDIHFANARKNLIAVSANSAAVLPLSLAGLVRWDAAALVLVGGLLGGELGRRSIDLLPRPALRLLIVSIGAVLSVYAAITS